MASFGGLMQPTPMNAPAPAPAAPTAPAAPAIGAGQQGTAANPDLVTQWLQYLSHPQVQAGLWQFASSVLQPVGVGETQMGRIGTALGDAGGAVGRVEAEQEQLRQNAIRDAQQQEQINLEERRTASDEKRVQQEGEYQKGQLEISSKDLALREKLGMQQAEIDKQRNAIEASGITAANSRQAAELAQRQKELDAQVAQFNKKYGLDEKATLADAQLKSAQAEYFKAGGASGRALTPQERIGVGVVQAGMEDFNLKNMDATPEQQQAEYNRLLRMTGLDKSMAGQASTGGPPPASTAPGAAPAPIAPSVAKINQDGSILLNNGNKLPSWQSLTNEQIKKVWANGTEQDKANFRTIYQATGVSDQEFTDKVSKALGTFQPKPAPMVPSPVLPAGQPPEVYPAPQ